MSTIKNEIRLKSIGIQSDIWPMIDELWSFYSKKGIRTVFVQVGVSTNAAVELEISETLGCPVHIWDVREETTKVWDEVKLILKDRKRPESASPFTEGADKKWVLPKNVRLYTGIPSFSTGTLEVQSKQYPTVSFQSSVKQMVESMKLTEERIDIMRVCLGEGVERSVLYALIDSPYRPGLLLVQWTMPPDSNIQTTLCAGHLQNSGYTLLARQGNNFLYLFNNECVYETCSWETNEVINPMVAELVKSMIPPEKNVTE